MVRTAWQCFAKWNKLSEAICSPIKLPHPLFLLPSISRAALEILIRKQPESKVAFHWKDQIGQLAYLACLEIELLHGQHIELPQFKLLPLTRISKWHPQASKQTDFCFIRDHLLKTRSLYKEFLHYTYFFITILAPSEKFLYDSFPFSEVVLKSSPTGFLKSVNHNPDWYK